MTRYLFGPFVRRFVRRTGYFAAILMLGLSAPVETPAQTPPNALAALVEVLQQTEDEQFQLDILKGMSDALQGRRSLSMPPGWTVVENELGNSENPQIRSRVQSLSLIFGSRRALDSLRLVLQDRAADLGDRRNALDALLRVRDPQLPQILQELLREESMRSSSLRALAAYEHPDTAQAILAVYESLGTADKRDALNTLAARPVYARELLTAVAQGTVPSRDLTAELVRQLRSLKSSELDGRIAEVWGVARETSADKVREMERYRRIYRAGGSQPGDAMRGRAVFARICQQCHTLFGTGGTVGPDITGSNRTDLNYLLETVVDPNAVIPHDYRAWTLDTKDDRVLTGIIQKEDAHSVTMATANETVVIPKDEIAALHQSQLSMMPEGLLDPLTDQEVRDLIYYLTRPAQVPLPATPDTVGFFFNEVDLSNWDGDFDLWRVEDGAIVGVSPGLPENRFLVSDLVFTDFRLICEVKLTPDSGNSGIQFRSEPLPNGEVKGYQADLGRGWWGKLYEEHGRALLWSKSAEAYIRRGDWNVYEILAVGDVIRTALNGQPAVDLVDPDGAKNGIVALQLHSGDAFEVRFRNFSLELNPEPKLKTVAQ